MTYTPDTIKQLRLSLSLNTATFGERIGYSGRTVEDWEQGRRVPSKRAEMLMDALARATTTSSPHTLDTD